MRRIDSEYREIHHIIPKCLGGTDDPSNLVSLTFEEHVEAHRILSEQNPNHGGLRAAYLLMSGLGKEGRLERNRWAVEVRDSSASVKKGWSNISAEERSKRNKEAAKKVDHSAKNVKRALTMKSRGQKIKFAPKHFPTISCVRCRKLMKSNSIGPHGIKCK